MRVFHAHFYLLTTKEFETQIFWTDRVWLTDYYGEKNLRGHFLKFLFFPIWGGGGYNDIIWNSHLKLWLLWSKLKFLYQKFWFKPIRPKNDQSWIFMNETEFLDIQNVNLQIKSECGNRKQTRNGDWRQYIEPTIECLKIHSSKWAKVLNFFLNIFRK